MYPLVKIISGFPVGISKSAFSEKGYVCFGLLHIL